MADILTTTTEGALSSGNGNVDISGFLSGGVLNIDIFGIFNDQDIYKIMAEQYNNMVSNPHNFEYYIKDIVSLIVNLDTSNYYNSINIFIIFIPSFNELLGLLKSYNYSDYNLVPSVRIINKYFKSKIDTSLTDFVNSIWEDEVPSNWKYLCQLSGEDVSNWNS